jgi:hypothetical protein
MASADVAAAYVTAAKPGMPTKATRVAPTKTAVPAASALCPHGHREEKGERRDGHQATHTK